jgi:glycosyltransferase involved in cell wall biosynthesis
MTTVTVMIPSRNEPLLNKTIEDLLTKARGEIEIIAVLDGYWPESVISDDRVHYIHFGVSRGMRPGLNAAFAISHGQYVMKLDAHCMVSAGFDVILSEACRENWVCVPSRYSLDGEQWRRVCVGGRHPINHLYIDLSNDGLNGKEWQKKNGPQSVDGPEIEDIIICQGSCYFMHRNHWTAMGLLDVEHYGTFRKDPQEVCWKTLTTGGRVVRVKSCWYAHLHKGRRWGRGYKLGQADYRKGDEYVKQWWTDSAFDGQQIPFREIVRRFPDMPGWEGHEWMTS